MPRLGLEPRPPTVQHTNHFIHHVCHLFPMYSQDTYLSTGNFATSFHCFKESARPIIDGCVLWLSFVRQGDYQPSVAHYTRNARVLKKLTVTSFIYQCPLLVMLHDFWNQVSQFLQFKAPKARLKRKTNWTSICRGLHFPYNYKSRNSKKIKPLKFRNNRYSKKPTRKNRLGSIPSKLVIGKIAGIRFLLWHFISMKEI